MSGDTPRWSGLGPGSAAIAGLVVLGALPLLLDSFGTFVVHIGLIYVVVAVGLHILVHWSGQISFGHIAFAALGAIFTARLSAAGIAFPLAIGAGVLVCLAFGLALGVPSLKIRGFYLAIITFAFGYATDRWLFRQRWFTGAEPFGGTLLEPPELMGWLLTEAQMYWLALAVLAGVLLLAVRLRHNREGRAWNAVRQSEELASSFGIPVASYKVGAFVLASGIAGLGGGLWAYALGVVDETAFPVGLSILFVTLVVIGGAGPVWGTAVVAFAFGVIPPLLGGNVAQWFDLIGPMAMLVIIIRYPGGQNQAGLEMAGAVRAAFRRLRPKPPSEATRPGAARAAEPLQARPAAQVVVRSSDLLADPLLSIDGISVQFGGLQALDDVSLTVPGGAITAVIGPNGAGKSTMMNCVSGFQRPDRGLVRLQGVDVTKLRPHARARAGLGRTFQHFSLCPDHTILENLLMAQHPFAGYGVIEGVVAKRRTMAQEHRLHERAHAYLDMLGLSEVAGSVAGSVPAGTAKLAELACALVTEPKLLLLDEPSGGLGPDEADQVREILLELHGEKGFSMLLVAHDMRLVMGMADYVHVLNFGRILARGTPAEILENKTVVDVYLGAGVSQ